MGRITSWALVLLGANCDTSTPPAPAPPPTPRPPPKSLALDVEIAAQLATRTGMPVSVQCTALPPVCTATLPDHTLVPIRIELRDDGWTWKIDGLLVTTDPIETYLRDSLLDLGVAQTVSCGSRLRRLDPGDRIVCSLAHEGKAFVTVNGDGSFAVELELDPIAAAARAGTPPSDPR